MSRMWIKPRGKYDWGRRRRVVINDLLSTEYLAYLFMGTGMVSHLSRDNNEFLLSSVQQFFKVI